jgi:hypothetical protein
MARIASYSGISSILVVTIIVVIIVVSSLALYFGFNYDLSPPSTTSGVFPYALTFSQYSICPASSSLYNSTYVPWSVTLSNGVNITTKVQPANSAVPNSSSSITGMPYNKQYSTITFYVANGLYSYTLGPRNFYVNQTSTSGSVTINGNNATVYVNFEPYSCGAEVTTTASS